MSHGALQAYATLKPAAVRWMLDAGTLSDLSAYGRLTASTREYVAAVARYDDEIGNLDWAAPPDWPLEDAVRRGGQLGRVRCVGTGLSAIEHQRRTIAGFLEATDLWPQLARCNPPYGPADSPFMPVLHGDTPEDFVRCAGMYEQAGVRLSDYEIVGVGSVCRRGSASEIAAIAAALAPLALALHWFGVELSAATAPSLTPYDVQIDGEWYAGGTASVNTGAWSTAARYRNRLPGCTHVSPRTGEPSRCTNCTAFASHWRGEKLGLFAA